MKFYTSIVLVISILFIFSSTIAAQRKGPPGGGRADGERPKVQLVGQILDDISGSGLEFATISVFQKRDSSLIGGGLSSADGFFDFEVSMGRFFAEVEFIGYEKLVVEEIEIDREKMRSGDRKIEMGQLRLSSSTIIADEVTIRAEKSENQFTLDKRVFNVGKDLANRGGTAEDLLDNVPSVTVDIEGNVSLRGSDGVRILINGQPSNLAQQNGLKSISADMIESVEVITNPSARYEAEGMAGIINIILKKERRSGFNGSFNSSVSYPLGGGFGANINYRKDKLNVFANYGLNYRSSPGFGYQYQEITRSELLISEQFRDMQRSGLSNNFRGGIEYFITDKQILSSSVSYRISDDNNLTTLTYNDYLENRDKRINLTERTDEEYEDEEGLVYNLDYNHEFSSREHKLTASYQYESDLEVEGSDFTQFESRNNSTLLQRSENAEGERNHIFRVDYQQPLSNKDHKYELGLRSGIRQINNDFRVDSLNQNMDWVSLAGFTNNFVYDEIIHAAYGQYGNKHGKFGYQVGLRAEYAIIKTELIDDNIKNERDSLTFFPSVFVNYEFNKGNALQVSYSRRIRRPRFWDLNPFFSFSDPRNFRSGNPFLRPEFTDSYDLNYLRYWENLTFSGGAFYRHSTDVIGRVRRLADAISFITQPENIGIQDDFGLEANATYSGLEWLRLQGNANFFRSITRSQNTDIDLNADTYVFTSRITARFTFWEDSDLQLRANYRSPRVSPQGINRSISSVDLGWSKDFLPKKNLTLTLSVRDLFNSRKRRYEVYGEDFFSVGEFQWRVRTFTLAANYRINQKKQRERGERGDGGDGEEF